MSMVQFIERNGVPEFVVLPIEVWDAVKHLVEDIEDQALFAQAEANDDGFRIPAAVLDAELAGDHPVKAWREYRGLTQEALAARTGVSKPYLSQVETRKRAGSLALMTGLSTALEVPIDQLVEQGGVFESDSVGSASNAPKPSAGRRRAQQDLVYAEARTARGPSVLIVQDSGAKAPAVRRGGAPAKKR
jgi:transcriptional regulator with XRE-family HTH domain